MNVRTRLEFDILFDFTRDTCLVPKLSKRQWGNRISIPYFFKIMSFYLYG